MYKYDIVGRSKIGKKLETYLINDKRFFRVYSSHHAEIIFLVGSKKNVENFKRENYPNAKIVDVSSHKRLSSTTAFVESSNKILYGIPQISKNYNEYDYISNPGCSAIGSILALTPIINEIEKNIILDVKFSKSSLTRNSSFNNQEDIMTAVHPYKHTHQKEVNYYFGNSKNIKMIPSIIDVPSGININVHAFKKNEKDNLLNVIHNFYIDDENIIVSEDKIPEMKDVINTNKVFIYVKEDGENIFINVVLDNLTVGGAYTAYINGLKIMGEKI